MTSRTWITALAGLLLAVSVPSASTGASERLSGHGGPAARSAAARSAAAKSAVVVAAARRGAISPRSIAEEAAFIEAAQLPNGAIETYPDSQQVNPYLGAYGAIGLARAAQLNRSHRDAADAWRWIGWYAGAEGPRGVVDNGIVRGHKVVSTGWVDSTDATAGVFLVAVVSAWNASRSRRELVKYAPAVHRAVAAVSLTLGPSGLTWAKPDYKVAYLMDEAEVYGGLKAAKTIETILGDHAAAAHDGALADHLALAVAGLWNPGAASFNWAVFPDGYQQPNNWSVLYPDSMEQIWAVAYGLVRGRAADRVVDQFLAGERTWDQPSARAVEDTNGKLAPATVSYWPMAVWALASTTATGPGIVGESAIRTAIAHAGSSWPYTPGVAGQLIVGQSLLQGLPAP